MLEWFLVLTGGPGEVRDISPQVVPGFTSKQNCEAAATTISHRLIALAGKSKEQRGVHRSSMVSVPSINFECVEVRK